MQSPSSKLHIYLIMFPLILFGGSLLAYFFQFTPLITFYPLLLSIACLGLFLMGIFNYSRQKQIILLQEEKRAYEQSQQESRLMNEQNIQLVRFAALLREESDSTQALCSIVLNHLAREMHFLSGAIYLHTKANNTLDLQAVFAEDKKQKHKKILQAGEDLCGQVFINKKSLHIKEVPEHYFSIQSGLGAAQPAELLFIPLLFNKFCLGVIELASFSAISPAQIELIEKIIPPFSATIANVQEHEHNRQILAMLHQQTEDLQGKEKELQHNLQKLKATQLEMEELKAKETKRREEQIEAQKQLMEKIMAKHTAQVENLEAEIAQLKKQ